MTRLRKPKIVVLGEICRTPVAGIVFQMLHYLIGFEQLGFETYYVEWHGNWISNPIDPYDGPAVPRVLIAEVMRNHGFADRWICRADHVSPGHTFGGMSYQDLLKVYAEAEAIVNVSGAHFLEDEQLQCPRRVYLETDPGIPQIRLEKGDPFMWDLVKRHTHHVTFAENLSNVNCPLPGHHLNYIPTRQPVLLSLWESSSKRPCHSFTTIARWRKNTNKSVEFGGEIYLWDKDVEFLKFLDLPKRTDQALKLGLSKISPEDKKILREHGWSVVDALSISASLNDYRNYIQESRGEFTIVKDQYVRLRTGSFNDRGACYLAAGKPVVTQDTGFSHFLPTGQGLFVFQTIDDILEAFDTINANYYKHCQAAIEIAHEYFDSKKVLGNLLKEIGLEPNPVA